MKNIDTCNLILKTAARYGVDYRLDVQMDEEANCPQIQIDIDFVSSLAFSFFFNTETDNIYYCCISEIERDEIDQNFEGWEREFNSEKHPKNLSLIKSDNDNTVHVYGEIDKEKVSAAAINEVFEFFMKPTGVTATLAQKSLIKAAF